MLGRPKKKTRAAKAPARAPRKPQATRAPTYRRSTVVSAADAPIGAWQQAMVPKLSEIAKGMGARASTKRAIVFLLLMQLKPHDDIQEFQEWAHQATGYARQEIAAFVDRAIKGSLIVDGRTNIKAVEGEIAEADEAVVMTMLAGVLEGKFSRKPDGNFFLPEAPA